MMRRMLAASLILTVAASARAEEPLSVGDPAPKLHVKEFVKGDPVPSLEKGKLYVVEFWATWCGPCRTSIPHLTEMAKKNKDVTFIGVSVWEQNQDKVKPFVEDMGDKMDYRVAMDDVPEGKKGDAGAMAKTWMTAADQNGIPTAFVIDKDGMIAWIGHPMAMEKSLEKIVAGKWDLKAEAVTYKEEKARAKKVQVVMAKMQKAIQGGDLRDGLVAVEDAIKDDPKLEPSLGRIKFQLCLETKDTDKAATYGRRLIEDVLKDRAEDLNELAWAIVDPRAVKVRKPDAKVVRVAVDAAAKAVDLTQGKDPNVLDTLAQADFVNGDVDKAIEVQQKALKINPDDAGLKDHLSTFKKAKEKEKDSK